MSGWVAVFTVVSAIDTHAILTGRPTLSSTFRAASRRHPVAVTAVTAYLVAHLYGWVPPQIDPLRNFRGDR